MPMQVGADQAYLLVSQLRNYLGSWVADCQDPGAVSESVIIYIGKDTYLLVLVL
jgi:hypothetical protein